MHALLNPDTVTLDCVIANLPIGKTAVYCYNGAKHGNRIADCGHKIDLLSYNIYIQITYGFTENLKPQVKVFLLYF